MKAEERNLDYTLPSNKFYPPHIDISQSLLRTRLLTTNLQHKQHNKKIIVIEAQAGQGKTTLASQFLDYNNTNYLWYQIGPEDSDPVLLLSSLLTNLVNNLPDFYSPQLTTILNEGSVGPLDLTRCANILLKDLDRYLSTDIYLVFDDLHLIEYNALTNSLLEYIIDTSPPTVHFVFISLQPASQLFQHELSKCERLATTLLIYLGSKYEIRAVVTYPPFIFSINTKCYLCHSLS